MEDFTVYTVGLVSGHVVDVTAGTTALSITLIASLGFNIAFVIYNALRAAKGK